MRGRMGLLLIAAGMLIVLAIGILTVGGPQVARQDLQDQRRLEDLNRIARTLNCDGWRGNRPALPEALSVPVLAAHCPGHGVLAEDLADPETGAAYDYRRADDRAFRLCASFHDPWRLARTRQSLARPYGFDPETGCVSGQVR